MSLLTWFRDTFVTSPSQQERPVVLVVDDPHPPMSRHRVCPKCGNRNVSLWSRRYESAGQQILKVRIHGDLRSYPVEVCERDEHIRVTCECSYSWNELTRDKDPVVEFALKPGE